MNKEDLQDELLAFANACEKTGMEKAAKICDDTDEGFDGVQYYKATNSTCADAIRAHKD